VPPSSTTIKGKIDLKKEELRQDKTDAVYREKILLSQYNLLRFSLSLLIYDTVIID
jgi:hypothetical protein